jgi:asparagine synthase (glutamine-hydrolysing)
MLKETVSILGDAYSSKQLERGLRFLTSLRDEFSNGYQNYNCFFTEEAKKRIYADSQAATSNINQSSFGLFSAVYKHEWDDLDKAFKIDISSYLPECLLYKTDIAAMAFGLELRAPLLDPTFMEFVSTIPAENKVDLIHKKIIFKHALVKNGILPKEVVYRKKRGFNAPLGKWLRTAGKGYVYETILAGDLQKTELFDMEQTKNYIDSFYASRGVSEHTIFALTMLSEWLRTYIYNN